MASGKAPLVPHIKVDEGNRRTAQGSGNGLISTRAGYWKNKGWTG